MIFLRRSHFNNNVQYLDVYLFICYRYDVKFITCCDTGARSLLVAKESVELHSFILFKIFKKCFCKSQKKKKSYTVTVVKTELCLRQRKIRRMKYHTILFCKPVYNGFFTDLWQFHFYTFYWIMLVKNLKIILKIKILSKNELNIWKNAKKLHFLEYRGKWGTLEYGTLGHLNF